MLFVPFSTVLIYRVPSFRWCPLACGFHTIQQSNLNIHARTCKLRSGRSAPKRAVNSTLQPPPSTQVDATPRYGQVPEQVETPLVNVAEFFTAAMEYRGAQYHHPEQVLLQGVNTIVEAGELFTTGLHSSAYHSTPLPFADNSPAW